MSDLIVLSPTETRVLDEFLSTGGSDRKLAKSLGMAHGTVKEHISHLRKKFGVSSKSQLMMVGVGMGWQGRPPC